MERKYIHPWYVKLWAGRHFLRVPIIAIKIKIVGIFKDKALQGGCWRIAKEIIGVTYDELLYDQEVVRIEEIKSFRGVTRKEDKKRQAAILNKYQNKRRQQSRKLFL